MIATNGLVTLAYDMETLEDCMAIVGRMDGKGRAITRFKGEPSIEEIRAKIEKKWKPQYGESFHFQDMRKGPRACHLPADYYTNPERRKMLNQEYGKKT